MCEVSMYIFHKSENILCNMKANECVIIFKTSIFDSFIDNISLMANVGVVL